MRGAPDNPSAAIVRALPPAGISVFPAPDRGAAYERLTKLAPVLLIQLNFVFLRSGFEAFPGGVAFRIGYSLHLLETHNCIAYVSSVMDGFFPFLGEGEAFIGDMIAASFSDLRHGF
jgi:hypothetical protein